MNVIFNKGSRQIYHLVIDFVTILIGFQLAYILARSPLFPWEGSASAIPQGLLFILSLMSAAMMIIIFAWQKLYRSSYSVLNIDGSRKFLRAVIMGEITIFIPFFYASPNSESTAIVTLSIMLIPFLLLVQKSLVGAVVKTGFGGPAQRKRLLIIGDGDLSEYLLRRAIDHTDPAYEPVGLLENNAGRAIQVVDTCSLEVTGKVPVLGTYAELPEVISRHKVEEIWINDPALSGTSMREIFDACQQDGVEVSVIPAFGELSALSLDVVHLAGIPIIRKKRVVPRPIYDFTKRLVDLAICIPLLTLLSPLMFAVALLIRLDSRGSALFKHKRIGYRGRPFIMFKFRTMYTDTKPYALCPQNRNDERITPVGRFLRRISIDELPQILNVIKGDMSLVGPRPEMPFLVQEYNNFQRIRLDVKPGITGLWQISADRSIPIHQNLDYDLYYLDNRSALLDLIILWRTVWQVFKGI